MWALERKPQTCCRLIPKSSWIRCFPDPQQSVKTSLETDQQHLRRGLELAQRSFGLASPNPNVGAVVVDTSGQVVGEGFHTYEGVKHAEVLAIEAAGEK